MTDFGEVRNQAPTPERVSDQSLNPDLGGELFAFPLSPAQERMWYATRENPDNPAYNGSFRWALEGQVDPRLVERTFVEIVQRHEALRTTFSVVDGHPVQIVSPHLELRVQVTDLRGLAADTREQEMDRLCAREASRPFDVENDALIRVGLLRMGDQHHILMLTLHHLVSDGWSIGLIMEEFQKIYGAFAENRRPAIPALPIQFADYAVWKNEQAQSGELDEQLKYWTKKLSGYRRLEVLPDFERPARRTTNAAIVSEMLPRSLTDALKDFSNQHGGTMFITSLAACMALLQHYTGEGDIAVGSPLAGRNRTDVENLMGLFVNHVVLRTSISGDPTFAEFATQVRDTAWEAFGHQDIPFENVLKALKPGTDALEVFGEPFFVINFICQREYGRASEFVFEFAGTRMSTMPSKSQGALYDLNFFLVEREAGWRLSIEYNTDLYSQKTAQQMLGDFQGLLNAVARNPQQRLSELHSSRSNAPETLQKIAPAPSNNAAAIEKPTQSEDSNASDVYVMPASLAQERFWLLSKLTPGNPAFHMPACVRLKGSVSIEALEKSFHALASRHEILRTTFGEAEGKLSQIISPNDTFSLEVADFSQASPHDADIEGLIKEEAKRSFDLATGPVWRAKLFRLGSDDHVLVITLHHILGDGWSHNIIQQDLWKIYGAASHGGQNPLPALSIQYGDFATWQKEWLASEDARENLDFWTNELSGSLRVLDFPTDHPPRRRISSRAGLQTFLLPQELTAALKAKSQSENVTSFMLFIAAFVTLLSRYANESEVIVGSPVANRRTETEPLIGPFSSPMAIRVKLPENPKLLEVLRQVREITFNALSHTELPFEVLLDKLDVRSAHGRNPLFQFYFFYQTAFLQPRRVGDLTVTPLPTVGLGTPFEMQLGIIERAEGVRLQIEYNADLFEQPTIERILGDYCKVLRSMAESVNARVGELRISAERQRKAVEQTAARRAKPSLAEDETEQRLAKVWQEVLGVQAIDRHDNYFELGGNSLLAVRLFSEIQKEFKVNLPLATLFEAQTVAELAKILRENSETGNWSPPVPIQ